MYTLMQSRITFQTNLITLYHAVCHLLLYQSEENQRLAALELVQVLVLVSAWGQQLQKQVLRALQVVAASRHSVLNLDITMIHHCNIRNV